MNQAILRVTRDDRYLGREGWRRCLGVDWCVPTDNDGCHEESDIPKHVR